MQFKRENAFCLKVLKTAKKEIFEQTSSIIGALRYLWFFTLLLDKNTLEQKASFYTTEKQGHKNQKNKVRLIYLFFY